MSEVRHRAAPEETPEAASDSLGGDRLQHTTKSDRKPMPAAEARALAAKLARAGLATFPISLSWNTEKGSVDKRPLTSDGFHAASSDPEEVERVFLAAKLGPRQHWGVGVWPGPGGYIVLDVDVKNGATGLTDLKELEDELGELPQATRVDTASGGYHFWFRRPVDGEIIGNKSLAPGVEIRCDKGYVVAPGVTSMWGDWKFDPTTPKFAETPPLPPKWAERLLAIQRGEAGDREPIPDRLTPGSRHDNLVRLAGAMRRQGAEYEEILPALEAMNERRGAPPHPQSKLEGIARDIPARYTPEPNLDIRLLLPGRNDEEQSTPLPFLTLAELAAKVDAAGPRRYLIRGIWPAGVYGVHAAEAKAQKTWNVGDLAVSVASGTPWLDHFPIDDAGPVVIFAGEGGEASAVRRLRAICDSRGLRAEDLDIHVCVRAPHLKDDEHMAAFAEKVAEVEPKLIVLDPFYLSAVGAKGGDLYGMGELLERAQIVSETYAAALVVVTHFNRGNRSGTNRITGAGPAEWARVVIGADVKSRHLDPDTKATTVLTALDVIGGEVPESAFRLKRVICADDPDDLNSPLRYSVEVIEDDDQGQGADDDMPPARRKLLEAVDAIGQQGATGRELVDWIADKYGHGLYRQTVSTELNTAQADGLVDSLSEPGKATIWFPPGGVSGGVVTTPTRHLPTGETRGVSSSSSHIETTTPPTPQKQAFDLSPEEISR